MSDRASTKTPLSTPTTQHVRLVLEAEIFQDTDGGPDSLIYSTDTVACEPVSPARMLGMVAEARAQLDAMERMAREFEARDTLAAIVAEHHLQLEEWDLANLDENLRSKFVAFAAVLKDGQRIVVVPQGQDPIKRVNAVSKLINDLQTQAAAA
jgi:hypothetical protein